MILGISKGLQIWSRMVSRTTSIFRNHRHIVAYGAPLEPEGGVNADEQGGRIEKRISTSHTSKQTFAFGGGVGDGAENLQGASNSTHSVNLLDQIESHVAENQTGAAKIYVHGDAKLPISFAHHYAFRDKKLIKVSAQEFRRCFQIRKETSPEDKRWLRTALKHPTMPKTNKRRRGRPCDRFVIRAPHPLCESHLIVRKLKLQSMIWKGARPLSMPDPLNESEDDPDLVEQLQQTDESSGGRCQNKSNSEEECRVCSRDPCGDRTCPQ